MNNVLNKYHVKAITLVCSAMILSGCGSIFSAAGPSKSSIINSSDKYEEQNYTLVPLSAKTIGNYMKPEDAKLKASVTQSTIPDTKLMSGDVLTVMIADNAENGGLFAPLAGGGTTFDKVRIDAHGKISLPYVNNLKISGLSLTQAQDAIKKSVQNYTMDPQVYISLTSELGASVLVSGDVNKPGRFSTLQGPLTVLDAVNQAGGPKLEPYLMNVIVRNGKTVQKFNYEELLNGQNFKLAPNSEVILERARKRFVAMGAVTKTGLHDFPSMNPSLLEVLGTVGGINESKADARGVFIFRMPEASNKNAKPKVFHLDMQNPTSMFLAKQFLVKNEDAVYVTNAGVYEFQKMISPIIQVLVLGNTISN